MSSGANKCRSDWRMLQSVCEQRVPKHVSIRGFKKVNVVLEAAVRRVGLLQSLLHALQLTLVAALHLGRKHTHKNQLCLNLRLKHVNLQSVVLPWTSSFCLWADPVTLIWGGGGETTTLGLFTVAKIIFFTSKYNRKYLIIWEHRSIGVLVYLFCRSAQPREEQF